MDILLRCVPILPIHLVSVNGAAENGVLLPFSSLDK